MKRPLIAAVFAGALVPGVIFLLLSLPTLLGHTNETATIGSVALVSMLFSLVPTLFALLAVLLYGLPAFLLLRTFRLANIFTCIAAALLPLAAVAAIPSSGASLGNVAAYSTLAVVSALAFWSFARKTVRDTNGSEHRRRAQ